MLVELIGCTSAGKSRLARAAVRDCRERGIQLSMGDDHVLQRLGLNWIKGDLPRTLLLDLIGYAGCLIGCVKNRKLYSHITRAILRLPSSVPLIQKLNIARNAFKKIGLSELIRRSAGDRQIVLMDEGALHTAHYLFVHESVEPCAKELLTFLELIPLPDIAVYVQQDEVTLIERVLKRGHRRIPEANRAKVARFVQRAVSIFERLAQQSKLRERLVVVDSRRTVVVPQEYRTANAAAPVVLDILDRVLRSQQQG